jgi:AraC-like DNA-binding protein
LARWRVVYDEKTDAPHFTLVRGFGHALLGPVMTTAFSELGISASLWEPTQGWLPLHIEPSVSAFEVEHGVEGRDAYNRDCLEHALKTGKLVRGEYRGGSDLFVPVIASGKIEAVMVVGSFLGARPSSAEILARWRELSGRTGHPTDPEFSAYFAELGRTLVLDEKQASAFETLVGCVAQLLSGEGDAERAANQASALRAKLRSARLVDRMWNGVRTIIDERSSRRWFSVHHTVEVRRLGLTRVSDHVAVGLVSSTAAPADAVDEAVRLDAFQRDAVRLARELGDVLVGKLGDRGVIVLSGAAGSGARKRERASEVLERIEKLARRSHGLSLSFGVSAVAKTEPLSKTYFSALAAAEATLSGEPGTSRAPAAVGAAATLRALRHTLGKDMEARPELLETRFERYVEAVLAHSAQRMEPLRAHLDVGIEKLAERLLESSALDEKTWQALAGALDRSVESARSVLELCDVYRRAASDLFEAVRHPVQARRDRSLRLALEYVKEHYTEPLRLDRVARIAGFAPSHFSRLFSQRERMSFEHYVQALRIERAKHLLISTDIDATRVADLSGFRSLQYFCRVFRRQVGKTPLEYRAEPMLNAPGRNISTHKNSKKANQRPRHAAKLER